MIEPTKKDIGKRVRWIQNNFGYLTKINVGTADVVFDYEKEAKPRIPFAELYWAADKLGRMVTGKREPTRHPRKAFRNFPPGRWGKL